VALLPVILWLKVKRYSSPEQVISELWDVTCLMGFCHMWSHSVTCHPTQVNTLRRDPSQAGLYSICLPLRDGRLSWPRWLVTYYTEMFYPPTDGHGRESNSQPVDHESNALTTTPKSHLSGPFLCMEALFGRTCWTKIIQIRRAYTKFEGWENVDLYGCRWRD